MKTFFEDYWDLCKDAGDFYKKHWKGTLVLNAVIIGGDLIYSIFYFHKDEIVDAVKEKLLKRKES